MVQIQKQDRTSIEFQCLLGHLLDHLLDPNLTVVGVGRPFGWQPAPKYLRSKEAAGLTSLSLQATRVKRLRVVSA